jgi:predicted nucleotidyltransferase component of viral defense system
MLNERQAIEVFHLLFLHAFGAWVDRSLYVLKGGCNLRFYCRSIRYSEDMDLDLRTMAAGTLRNNVERVLNAPALAQALRAQRLELEGFTAPKQTETTQRWKLTLRILDRQGGIPTKIEFSRRKLDDGVELQPVDPEIVRRYRLYPVLTQHYIPATAFRQKVAALAHRNETQARDLFDLKLLLDQGAKPDGKKLKALLPAAIENALSIGYDQFAGQVLAYLEPEYQDHYRPRTIWESLQAEVIQQLEALVP